MSKTLQIQVDPFLCASQERTISGALHYPDLMIIQHDIDPSSGPIEANLTFSKQGSRFGGGVIACWYAESILPSGSTIKLFPSKYRAALKAPTETKPIPAKAKSFFCCRTCPPCPEGWHIPRKRKPQPLNSPFCLFGKLQLDYPDEIINNTGFPLVREWRVFSIGYILVCHPCESRDPGTDGQLEYCR